MQDKLIKRKNSLLKVVNAAEQLANRELYKYNPTHSKYKDALKFKSFINAR